MPGLVGKLHAPVAAASKRPARFLSRLRPPVQSEATGQPQTALGRHETVPGSWPAALRRRPHDLQFAGHLAQYRAVTLRQRVAFELVDLPLQPLQLVEEHVDVWHHARQGDTAPSCSLNFAQRNLRRAAKRASLCRTCPSVGGYQGPAIARGLPMQQPLVSSPPCDCRTLCGTESVADRGPDRSR